MIKLIVTGGTLDKRYNELTGELFFPETHVSVMLTQARCKLDIELEVLMLKDSLDMNAADRERMSKSCLSTNKQQIVMTHGTDTMVESAAYLAAQIKNKTLVLVGAMIPYTITHSDALFNLGCALTAVQLLPAGVYITMNGKVFAWDKVSKDKQAGEFIAR